MSKAWRYAYSTWALTPGLSAGNSVREDRLLPRVDAWLCQLFSPEHIAATAASVVEADSQRNEEDPETVRARRVIAQCDRKLETHLRGLEQGIPANLIAPRIEATQKEKTEAEAILACTRPKAETLTIEQVIETLSLLRDVPELLAHIDQADRAKLYRHLDINLTYKREDGTEKVCLTCTPSGVDQKRVGGGTATITTPAAWQMAWAA
jgi:hypothetical protein